MVKSVNANIKEPDHVLSQELKPYLRAISNILKEDGHSTTYCEALLSNIYHHAHSLVSEKMAHYALEDAIRIAIKQMEPAETYRQKYCPGKPQEGIL